VSTKTEQEIRQELRAEIELEILKQIRDADEELYEEVRTILGTCDSLAEGDVVIEELAEECLNQDLAIPAGDLSGLGLQAACCIRQFLYEKELTFTGGCRLFYSPQEWKDRGEHYCTEAELILVYDGGDFHSLVHSVTGESFNKLSKRLAKLGLYIEPGTGWYAGVYKI
jgi:hypothetical protein